MFAQRVARLAPYVPGEQPGPRPGGRSYVKLNANENPYPPSPLAVQAVTRLLTDDPARLARYPDPDSAALRAAVAALLNTTGGVLTAPSAESGLHLTPDMIFLANGSDEALSFLFYAFFDSEGRHCIVQTAPTYSFYPVYAGFYGIPLCAVPLFSDFRLDTGALVKGANETDSSIILANPNAPTGMAINRALLRALPPDRVHVVDEAYADFAAESALPLLAEFPNLAIVRTFSKSMSFAGMRLGYVAANPPLIAALTTVKNSFNHFPLDVLTQTAGIAACGDVPWYAENVRRIVAQRESFGAVLRHSGWQVLPSQANFLFAQKPGTSGREIYERCKAAGILVRHFPTPPLDGFVRITIGTAEEMAALEECLAPGIPRPL
ncbi:MAG: aminotransferase class I/II-fold pyridoxal phosphate-dependent enzyme [Spirochaetaceae bacterium]|jgi:histidinol-phosphate aminotransferase|nr:aminotransferase class I/II-fold pyridoxal phosphate-dependent enzyme [Spirochaetaceae bacterium]